MATVSKENAFSISPVLEPELLRLSDDRLVAVEVRRLALRDADEVGDLRKGLPLPATRAAMNRACMKGRHGQLADYMRLRDLHVRR